MKFRPVLTIEILIAIGFAAWYFKPWQDRSIGFNEAVAAQGVQARYVEGEQGFRVDEVVRGLELPWDMAFLSNAEILVTEKGGRLLRVDLASGRKTAISGVPESLIVGQGGLHAVVLHPEFANNQLVYLSYAAQTGKDRYTTRLSRGRLDGDALKDVQLLISTQAETGKGQHFGGAILFDREGYLYLSIGDRGDRADAQNLGRHNGKLLRLKDDGSVPADNPFVNTPGALPEIWSYGHRNPQGLGLDPSGQVWAVEHGPRGGDELNLIQRGKNYGWPVITYGKEYVGGSIGEGTAKEGMEQPVHYYVPSIATGGMSYYSGAAFPQWKDSVFITSLKDNHLNRVQLREGRFVSEERLLRDRELRLRSVRVSPAGEIWVVSDNGVILRLSAPSS